MCYKYLKNVNYLYVNHVSKGLKRIKLYNFWLYNIELHFLI